MNRRSMRRYHTYPPHRAPVGAAKGALCGPVGTHRAPIGALCEGLYAALRGSFNDHTTCSVFHNVLTFKWIDTGC